MILILASPKSILANILMIILANIYTSSSASPGITGFRIKSWNAKYIGPIGQNLNASAILMLDADVVAIQEIDKCNTMFKVLKQLISNDSKKLGHKYCVAISDIPKDSMESYGFICREDRLFYATTRGKIIYSCRNSRVTTSVIRKAANFPTSS